MSSPPLKSLTLRDVSQACGVSEMTVSRVLRGRAEVSVTTRDRVLATAREMGYVPNRIAGSLASSRVNLVAVIIPSLSNLVFPDVLSGISEVLESTELQPVVGVTDYIAEKEERVLYDLLSWRPSGLILAGVEHSQPSRRMMAMSGIPVVEIMDVDGEAVDSVVGISHRRAGLEMAQAIVAAGYRRIGFMGTKLSLDHRARKRFDGFTEGLAREGLSVIDHAFYDEGSAIEKGREMTIEMLQRNPDLDFLYYSNDLIGAGGLLYLTEKGYDIPGKIGLAGFNGVSLLQGLPKRLATMDSCRGEIGRRAAEIIVARHSGGKESPTRRIELTPQIRVGDTLRQG